MGSSPNHIPRGRKCQESASINNAATPLYPQDRGSAAGESADRKGSEEEKEVNIGYGYLIEDNERLCAPESANNNK